MTKKSALDASNTLVLLASAGLLLGAIAFERIGGLHPCEMCMWQRWPHLAAIVLGLAAIPLKALWLRREMVANAIGALATSGGLAVYHLGVERRLWEGHTACTSSLPTGLSTREYLDAMMKAPLVRCDTPQWTFAGLSLADLNAIASLGAAAVAVYLLVLSIRTKEA